jgi:16S rRNA (guanine1516-N2)-methyltransferase
MPVLINPDLFVTTASHSTPALRERAEQVAIELSAPVVPRHQEPLAKFFTQMPEATRAIVVQKDRLLLVHKDGVEFFYHPNLGYLRLSNYLQGQNDWLLAAAEVQPTDAILDCTLGYAGEATLFATQVGDTGEVHGIEGIPELGIIVREGLQTTQTQQVKINEAMRRVKVVHLGHHLEYLQTCPDKRYDIVYFDPFFDVDVDKPGTLNALRFFGDHRPLTLESVNEAKRVARRFVIIKAGKWSHQLETFGIALGETFGSKYGTVQYGRIRV